VAWKVSKAVHKTSAHLQSIPCEGWKGRTKPRTVRDPYQTMVSSTSSLITSRSVAFSSTMPPGSSDGMHECYATRPPCSTGRTYRRRQDNP